MLDDPAPNRRPGSGNDRGVSTVKLRKIPLSIRISLVYLIAGILWILISDQILVLITGGDAQILARLQTFKGWFFILFTTLILFAYLQRQLGKQQTTSRALEESEARYRSLTNDVLDQASVGVVIHDSSKRITWINRTFEKMLNLSRGDLLGRSSEQVLETFLSTQLDEGTTAAEDLLKDYQHSLHETGRELLFRPVGDQKAHWIEYSSQQILTGFYAGGRIEYYTDITERKRAMAEIQRRARHQEAINSVIAAASQVMDLEDLLDTALSHCMDVLAGEAGVIWAAGTARTSGIPEDQQDSVRKAAVEYFPERVTCSGCGGEKGPDFYASVGSSPVMASITAPVQAEGKVVGGISLGVGDRREWSPDEVEIIKVIGQQLGGAVERLELLETTQAQAGQLQLILDTVQEGMITLNAEKRILIANPAARQLLPLLTESQPGEILERIGDWTIDDLLQNNRSEPALVFSGQPERCFEVHIHQVGKPSAEIAWTILLRDVTEMRLAQERVIRQERRAAIGQLASGIAHDFNNIMAVVILYSEMLQDEAGLSERGRERLTTIAQQAERAARLTNQILDFSRTTAMEFHPVDLIPFMKNFQVLLERTLPASVKVTFEYGDQDYFVNIDPNRIQQVLLNLALNARDAMPEGGTLGFTLDRHEFSSGQGPIDGMEPGAWVAVSVSDTGTGMDDKTMQHLFEPFFSTKDPGEGTGLGLAQVDGIIKQHSGFVNVESKPGKGSVFSVYLPAVRSGLVPGIIHDVESMLDRTKRTILVVEDDTAVRSAVSEQLESMGYKVLRAASGQEALDTLSVYGVTIDLVLSDLVMPGISGEDLCRILQKRYPNMKILMMTGYPLAPSSRDLLRQDGIGWIQKPLNAAGLESALRSIFRDSGPEV